MAQKDDNYCFMCKEKKSDDEFKLLDFDVSHQQDQFEWDIVFSLRFEW